MKAKIEACCPNFWKDENSQAKHLTAFFMTRAENFSEGSLPFFWTALKPIRRLFSFGFWGPPDES